MNKKALLLILTIAICVLTSCGINNDTVVINKESDSSISVSFDKFNGSKDIKIKSGAEDNTLVCRGALTSGSVTIYCNYDGVEREVMTIESKEDYETYFEIPSNIDVKISIKAKSNALDGNFSISTRSLDVTSPGYLKGIAPLGSGNFLEGNVVVVSVIVQNMDDFSNVLPIDNKKVNELHKCLGIACEFIEKEVARYGKTVEFIWDWKEDDALYYQTVIEPVFPPFEHYLYHEDYTKYFENAVRAFLRDSVDSRSLRMKYNTRNIIYIVCKDPDTTCNMLMDKGDCAHANYSFEWVDIFMREQFLSATLAHEMLHLFGGEDLYPNTDDSYGDDDYAYENFLKFRDYLTTYFSETHESDIMRNNSEATPHKIEHQITEISAYYLGLIEKPDIIKEWNLYDSDYDILKNLRKSN